MRGRRERRATPASPGARIRTIHLYMLERSQAYNFRFDAVQMPINALDAHFRSFETMLFRGLKRILGMKSMGDSVILNANVITKVDCLE